MLRFFLFVVATVAALLAPVVVDGAMENCTASTVDRTYSVAPFARYGMINVTVTDEPSNTTEDRLFNVSLCEAANFTADDGDMCGDGFLFSPGSTCASAVLYDTVERVSVVQSFGDSVLVELSSTTSDSRANFTIEYIANVAGLEYVSGVRTASELSLNFRSGGVWTPPQLSDAAIWGCIAAIVAVVCAAVLAYLWRSFNTCRKGFDYTVLDLETCKNAEHKE